MKSLFKVTLLTASMAFAAGTMANEAPAKPAAPAAAASTAKFDSEDHKAAYALGASLGAYMANS